MGRSEDLLRFVPDRPGHDRRYAMDHSKITQELGWQPTKGFAEGLEETIRWYGENQLLGGFCALRRVSELLREAVCLEIAAGRSSGG
jgi:dTDP-D-glucose 4,6-dehydratase